MFDVTVATHAEGNPAGIGNPALLDRLQRFCEAHSEKADGIGRFLRMMEARIQYCRSEAGRLQERARSSERKVTQTKHMVMYYLKSRDLKKIEGREFTLNVGRIDFCVLSFSYLELRGDRDRADAEIISWETPEALHPKMRKARQDH